ncbi:MAG TPA: YbjN domain-containing protein [Acidimicrobiales bacterium]|nr:YbjN domain-containing protein [Acidimicrobiales bacterium]
MPVDAASPDELAALGQVIDDWAGREKRDNPLVAAVDHDPARNIWFVRLKGEEKSYTTVWLTLRQRTLHYETQFMPAPEENVEALYDYLMRLNNRLFAMRFAIGEEDAIYLVGQLPVGAVDADELDRIVGSAYAYTEQYFRPAMRLGYASKFKG